MKTEPVEIDSYVINEMVDRADLVLWEQLTDEQREAIENAGAYEIIIGVRYANDHIVPLCPGLTLVAWMDIPEGVSDA